MNDENEPTTTTSPPTTTPTTQAWAVMEGMMGNLAKARELVLDGLRIDPYHGALWTVYAIIERQDGSHAKARKVYACDPWYSALPALSGCPSVVVQMVCIVSRARVFVRLQALVRLYMCWLTCSSTCLILGRTGLAAGYPS